MTFEVHSIGARKTVCEARHDAPCNTFSQPSKLKITFVFNGDAFDAPPNIL